jgi:transposase
VITTGRAPVILTSAIRVSRKRLDGTPVGFNLDVPLDEIGDREFVRRHALNGALEWLTSDRAPVIVRECSMPKLFAGLDVSDQTTAICVLNSRGKAVCETQASSTPTAIAAVLKSHRRFLVAVAQETGTKASWLHKELLARRFPMLCLDARHVKAALAAKPNKTDANDARGIATMLRRGVFTAVHMKSDEAVRLRLLLSTRKTLQRKAIDLQTSIRMVLKTAGARLDIRRRRVVVMQSAKTKDEMLSRLVQLMASASNNLLAEVKVLDRLIAENAENDPVCRRLLTIPGVGPLTATAFRAAVDDPVRFKDSRTVAAYFGLTPRRFQSGKTNVSGRITRRGDMSVRSALYSAACSLLNTSKSQWVLRSWGLRLAKRKGFKVAAVACARKLAVEMHRLWISGEEFDPNKKPRPRPAIGSQNRG